MSLPSVQESPGPLVVRSHVAPETDYRAYRPKLRHDFYYSCAYCTMSEAEAKAIRFTIDHYEPRQASPSLICEYSNLMYACDECNSRKGDRCPPETARQAGYRFFKADIDRRAEHFELSYQFVRARSPTGCYTIEALDLNRSSLKRLRDLRGRIQQADEEVSHLLTSLKEFPLDALPREVRARALSNIRKAGKASQELVQQLDDLLRANLRSELIDAAEEGENRNSERRDALQRIEGIFPGKWRAPRKGRRR